MKIIRQNSLHSQQNICIMRLFHQTQYSITTVHISTGKCICVCCTHSRNHDVYLCIAHSANTPGQPNQFDSVFAYMLFTWQHYYGAYEQTRTKCAYCTHQVVHAQGNAKITKQFAQVLVAYEWKVRQLALCTHTLHHWMPRVCTHKTHE